MVENLAIVDLGSNSARMAITEIAPDGRFREIRRVKENTRLSEGMGREKMLQESAIERTIAALKRFKKSTKRFLILRFVRSQLLQFGRPEIAKSF